MIELVPFRAFMSDSRRLAQIDEIFYEASSVKSFVSEEVRAAFHWRWLGRYLTNEPQHAFLAVLAEKCDVCGYVVGSLDDPAQRREFAELEYFAKFAPLTARYPAHLHINVASEWRSRGIGEMLVEAFAAHAQQHGSPGVHVVTGKGMRNVSFYSRLGFAERGVASPGERAVVLLGRQL